jgi:hypothetical protein
MAVSMADFLEPAPEPDHPDQMPDGRDPRPENGHPANHPVSGFPLSEYLLPWVGLSDPLNR